MAGTESRDTTAVGPLPFQSGEPSRVLHTFAGRENRRGNARQPQAIQPGLTVLDGGFHVRATQGHVHPHALPGGDVLHEPPLGALRPMLVVPAPPPVAQPVHDTFRITSPHTIPIRVQAEEHTAPRMTDFQNSYFLTHAYNDTILLSNQQYEKACRPGIEIPGLHAKNVKEPEADPAEGSYPRGRIPRPRSMRAASHGCSGERGIMRTRTA